MSNQKTPDLENDDESDVPAAENATEEGTTQEGGEKKAATPAQGAARSASLQGGVHN